MPRGVGRGKPRLPRGCRTGRNRLAEFTGEFFDRHPAATSLGFILRPSASYTEPIAEGGMYLQRPKATEAGAPAPA